MAAEPVYLDNWAATLMPPEAVEAMTRWCNGYGGDPAAARHDSKLARAMLRGFRDELAVECGFRSDGEGSFTVVFTSGAAESNSAIITGAVSSFAAKRRLKPHVIISEAEPPSILACCARLQKDGRCLLTVLPVGRAGADPARLGLVEPGALKREIRAATCLVSISPHGGEAGTLEDLAVLAKLTKRRGVPLHTDASAGFGLAPVRPAVLGIDAVTLDFRQLHGAPAGALIIRTALVEGYDLCPIIHGRENGGLRGGAENIPGLGASLVGFRLAMAGTSEAARVAQLRDALKAALARQYPSVDLDEFMAGAGAPNPVLVWIAPAAGRSSLPGLLLFAVLASASARALTAALEARGVIVGDASRAAPPDGEPPESLGLYAGGLSRRLYFGLDAIAALGLPSWLASKLVRVSLSRYSTADDIKAFAKAFAEVVPAAPEK